jgi:hypothetical protein
MKGIVFTEFIEMVENSFSAEIADRIIDESDLPSGGVYTAVGTYSHHEMVSMVVKLSEITEMPIPALIKAFGQYLFGRFHTFYPVFFEGINSSLDFLSRIEDVIHVEVKKLYPDAQLPKFDIERPEPNKLLMTYRSDRHFGDLAEGLIDSCVKHFGDTVTIQRENLDATGATVRFTLVQTA